MNWWIIGIIVIIILAVALIWYFWPNSSINYEVMQLNPNGDIAYNKGTFIVKNNHTKEMIKLKVNKVAKMIEITTDTPTAIESFSVEAFKNEPHNVTKVLPNVKTNISIPESEIAVTINGPDKDNIIPFNFKMNLY